MMVASRGVARRVVAVSIAVAALLSACGGNDDEAGSTTTSTPRLTTTTSSSSSSSSNTAADAAKAEVVTAYEAASRAFIDAAAIPDPNFPALADTHVDPMLQQRRETLLGLEADGRAIRYPTPSQYRIEVEDVTIEGDVARFVACVVDDGERVEVATGNVIAGGVGTVEWRVAMRRVDGRWRLAERLENARWDGVAGCAAE